MDNDDKIIVSENENKIHNEVMLFLGDELENIRKNSKEAGARYDIEKEYEKTKEHKSPFVILILLGCFLFVFGVSFFIDKIISVKNQEIKINLQVFEDLNLKTLLNTVSSAQNNYDNAVKSKSSIEANMESKLKNAQEIFNTDVFALDSLNLPEEQYELRLEEIKKQYDDSTAEIHKEFDESILQAEKQIQEYKKQLAEFDTAKIEAAREQEKALNSERQLRQLETEKLTATYENRIAEINKSMEEMRKRNNEEMRKKITEISQKYQAEIDRLDPELRDNTANDIIGKNEIYEAEKFNVFDKLAERNVESEKVKNVANEYQKIYDEYDYIDRAVAAIPQKKSIPKYVETSRNLVNSMGDKFLDATIAFYDETRKLNSQIEGKNREIERINENLKKQQADYEETLLHLMESQKISAVVLKVEVEEEKILELTEDEIQNEINALYEIKKAEYDALKNENSQNRNAETTKEEQNGAQNSKIETTPNRNQPNLNPNSNQNQEDFKIAENGNSRSSAENPLKFCSDEELREQIEKEVFENHTIVKKIQKIRVYVAPQAREAIAEDGISAEIKEKSLKGKIISDADGSFSFEILPDKNGALPEIDYAELQKGLAIKISSK